MEYEQLTAFVATMQLLVNYSHSKQNERTLKAHTVAVKTDDLSDIENVESLKGLCMSYLEHRMCVHVFCT